MSSRLPQERAVELAQPTELTRSAPAAVLGARERQRFLPDTPKSVADSVFPLTGIYAASSISVRARRSLLRRRLQIEPLGRARRATATRAGAVRCPEHHYTCHITCTSSLFSRHLRRVPTTTIGGTMGRRVHTCFLRVCRAKAARERSISRLPSERTIEALSRALDGTRGPRHDRSRRRLRPGALSALDAELAKRLGLLSGERLAKTYSSRSLSRAGNSRRSRVADSKSSRKAPSRETTKKSSRSAAVRCVARTVATSVLVGAGAGRRPVLDGRGACISAALEHDSALAGARRAKLSHVELADPGAAGGSSHGSSGKRRRAGLAADRRTSRGLLSSLTVISGGPYRERTVDVTKIIASTESPESARRR